MQNKSLFCMLVCVVLSAALPVVAQNWQDRKDTWEPLLDARERIAMMAGGDLNGDYVDDIAVIYRGGPDQGLVVLISDRDEYHKHLVPGNYLDLAYNSEIARAQQIWIRDGSIEILCPFDGTRLLSDVTSNEAAMLRFKFFESSLKLTDIIFNAELSEVASRAQVWYDVNIGRMFVNYLAEAERVGGKRSYFFRYYYRFTAYPVENITIDAQENEWSSFSYPVYLKNLPVGNPVNYGFERWKSDFDLSGQVYVGYDSQHLYFFMKVYDDVFNQIHTQDNILRGDHIELWFADKNDNKVQIGISPGNFMELLPEARLWYQGSRAVSAALETITIASQQIENGYALEFSIPWNVLPAGYSTTGTQAFSLTFSDSDQASKQEKLLSSSSLRWGESYSLGELVFQ